MTSKTHSHFASSNCPKTNPFHYHTPLVPRHLIGPTHVIPLFAVSPIRASDFPRESAKSQDPASLGPQWIGAHLFHWVPIPIHRSSSNTNTNNTAIFVWFPRGPTRSEHYSQHGAKKESGNAEYSEVSPIFELITAVLEFHYPRFLCPSDSSTGERPFFWRWFCCSTNSVSRIRFRFVFRFVFRVR